MSDQGVNVQVAVRCRPINAEERKAGHSTVVTCDSENKAIKVAYGPAGKKFMKSFNFDKVFGMYSRQEEVFNSMVKPIVEESLAGFNCTIFAYGQTGTGKTHTMEGNIHSEEDAGIVPRSVKYIVDQLEKNATEFTIRVSFLELYNEELQDLLNINGDKKLKLCEDVKKGVVCQNLEEVPVFNVKEIFELLQKGIQARQTAATLCNKNSSRSHSIFTMKIMIKEYNVEGEEVIRHGQLNLVDLAGSECIGRSGAKNDRAREAGSINQSLLTLGRVITALVDHHGHVPYRDSKLTRLLQESLGGKAKTCIIATFSPSQSAVEETMSTLDYANRAKSIKNQPTVNQRMTKKVIMKEYCAEIEHLKNQLMQTREKNGVYLNPADFYAMEAKISAQESQLTECESALKLRNEEVKILKEERDGFQEKFETLQVELDSSRKELIQTKSSLQSTQSELKLAFVELKATDKVVQEQTHTEAHLYGRGTQLLADVKKKENEIESLFSKIDRFYASEKSKLSTTEKFLGSLNENHHDFSGKLQEMLLQSQKSSKSLSEGVNQMLFQGRTTCEVLKSSIDEALVVLKGDAEVARESMSASCTSLNDKLKSTNSHLESTLMSLQAQLSQWLGEADQSLQQVNQILEQQSSQIVATQGVVEKHGDAVAEMSQEYFKTQQRLKEQVSESVDEMKHDLVQRLDHYKQEAQKFADQSNSMIQTKASELESVFQKFMREMVSSSTQAFTQSSQMASQFYNQSNESLQGHVNQLGELHTEVFASSTAMVDQVSTEVTKFSREAINQIEVVRESRAAASQGLKDISQTVGAKRKFLDETVTSLTSDVKTSIDQSCQSVQETSQSANQILYSINEASSRMDESASQSMNEFVAYLDKEGEVLSQNMMTYFEGLGSDLAMQQTRIQDSEDQAKAHGEAMLSLKISASGSTPKKVPPPTERPPFKKTRCHVDIRAEVIGQLNESTLSIEEVSQQLKSRMEEGPKQVVPELDLSSDSLVGLQKATHGMVNEVSQELEKQYNESSKEAKDGTIESSNANILEDINSSPTHLENVDVDDASSVEEGAEVSEDNIDENANPNRPLSASSQGSIKSLGSNGSHSEFVSNGKASSIQPPKRVTRSTRSKDSNGKVSMISSRSRGNSSSSFADKL